MTELKWINALNDDAVTYAAEHWCVSKTQARARLDLAIKNEEVSAYLPQEEFSEYVQIFTPSPPLPFQSPRLIPKVEDYFPYINEKPVMPKPKETNQSGWSDFLFFVFVLIIHSFIWRNWEIPYDAGIPFFFISIFVSIAIVAAVVWLIGLIKYFVEKSHR